MKISLSTIINLFRAIKNSDGPVDLLNRAGEAGKTRATSFAALFNAQKNAHIRLKESLPIEELFILMAQRWDKERYGNFSLETSKYEKVIKLDDYLGMGFAIKVQNLVGKGKNLLIYIEPRPHKSTPPDMETQKKILAYFNGLSNAMRDMLGDNVWVWRK